MFKISTLALALLASTVSGQGDFDWDISENETNFAVVSFSDATADSEIILNYNAAVKNTTVRIFDYDNCNSTVGIDGGITTTESFTGRTATALPVELDINQTAISSSSLWDGTDPAASIIAVCVRIDVWADLDTDGTLFEDGESINFHETKLEITVDMTEGFTVTGVTTNRTAATETDKNATLDYAVLAFETDDNGADITGNNQQYTQGDFLQIGIKTNGTGVKVANIIDMTLTGDTTYESIRKSDAEPSALTQRTCEFDFEGSGVLGCKVKTMLVSDFFVNANPSPINVTGTAVMAFAGARRLSSFRGLQASTDDTNEEFGLSVPLQPMDIGNDGDYTTPQDDIDMTDSAAPATIVVGMVSFVVAVFSFFLI